MRYDDIIIGGGLSGLVCGIRLQRAGRKTLIVSMGQNAMHFSSGAFGLLSKDADGSPVENPLEAAKNLPEAHPYRKIGLDKVAGYVAETKMFFSSCGVSLVGNENRNSWMLSATGNLRPAWLALEDVTLLADKNSKIGDKALIANLKGYLDFNVSFILEGLERQGVECRAEAIDAPEFDRLRKSPTEMRSVNIARVIDQNVDKIAGMVKALVKDEDVVVLPAVFGLRESGLAAKLGQLIGIKVVLIGTMPPSVPGIRSQYKLKLAYEAAGGTFLLGDEACRPEILDHKVTGIHTENFGDLRLEAENFVLASGSFFSRGLMSTPDCIYEPLFGADVDASNDRADWYDKDFFAPQNYIGYGVKSDGKLRLGIGGETIGNLYGIGSVLGGCNSMQHGCGAGVAIVTAMSVADNILGR